ncbi:MAG: DUF4340 domain-containing protein [Opitutae bacterium]|nr:DUF4340 domain-containing protein [Opitutae bacterium]MBT6850951.1 DUF4340 domain-containing protein [Opitutae bacterium]MBT7924107.1 DUF4340 domain-containing protein [Opitutae bacterium]
MKPSTLLLIALNAVTFFGIYQLTNKDENSTINPTIALVQLLGDPQKITIGKEFPVNTSLTLEKEESGWNILTPMKWKADEFATSKLTGRLRHIEARRLFSLEEIKEKGESLADYGLDRSDLTITVESKSGKVTLAFGSPTRDGRERYVMPDFDESEKTEIWAVNASLWDTANISVAEWMEREFLKFPVYDVRAFGIRIKQGDTLVKTRIMRGKSGEWNITSPIQSPADTDNVRLFLNQLISSKAIRFVTDPVEIKSLSSRLDSPVFRIYLEGSSSGRSIIIGEPIDEEEGANLRPAQVEGESSIFIVNESLVSLLANAEGRLRDRQLLALDSKTIGTIEIYDSNLRLSLHKLEDGRWEVILLDDEGEVSTRPGDVEIIENFLYKLLSLEALTFVSDAPSEEDLKGYGFDQPRHSVTLSTMDGETVTLRIGHHADGVSGWYARRDNAPFVFTADETIPFLLAPSPLRFRKRLLERLPQAIDIKDIRLMDIDVNSTEISLDNNQTKDIEYFLRNFIAREIISEKYLPNGIRLRGQTIPWRYELQSDLALPGGEGDGNETLVYRFTDRIGGQTWGGGSPSANLSFLIPIGLMDLLSKILPDDSNPNP